MRAYLELVQASQARHGYAILLALPVAKALSRKVSQT